MPAAGDIVFRPGSLSYFRCALAARSMVPLDLLLPRRLERAFGIVTYHRISPRRPGALPNLNVTPERLRSQLSGLLRRGFEAWPLRKTVDFHGRGETIPRNVFVVVFDDGYAGVLQHALPVLEQLKVPATVFLPTAHLDTDTPRPFDPWGLAEGDASNEDAWRILGRDECRRLQDSGWVELGSHTHLHQDLRGQALALRRDIAESVELLDQRFAVQRPLFSFPFGYDDPAMRTAAAEAGVACGLTADCQLVTPADDLFAWGRFGAEQFDSAASLAAKLNGVYSSVQNLWRRLKRPASPRL